MIAPTQPTANNSAAPPAIAAFFDIDGTLLAPPSLEWRFLAYLLAHDDLPASNILRWLARCATQLPAHPRAAFLANKSYLAALPASLLADWQRSLASAPHDFDLAPLPLFAAALTHLHWHAAQRHRIFLVSGTLAPLARILAARISAQIGAAVEVCATELELRDQAFTGRLAGDHLSGPAKSRALRHEAARHALPLQRSFAYGNSLDDLPMLASVGHPIAVNPSRRLAARALQRHWPAVRWTAAPAAPAAPSAAAESPRPRTLSPRGAR